MKKNYDFYQQVYEVIEKIPIGNVTTYGDIAESLGAMRSARLVGSALRAIGMSSLPCHRVVNKYGELTGKHAFNPPTLMKELLLKEGIEFINERVDIKKHLWIP
jgi:O-6-methylguanine DNA methyltransferase